MAEIRLRRRSPEDRDLYLQGKIAELIAERGAAYQAGREAAARDILDMLPELGDEGWGELERRAAEAGWPVEWVRDRRARDDFTTATIESAYQYGYRRAAEVARDGQGS